MLRVEKGFLSWAQKHAFWIFAAGAFIASLLLRYVLLPCFSADLNMFLIPWYEEIVRNGGMQALADHSANYNSAYMMLLVLATKLPMEPIYAIKLFSVLGDYLMAFAVALVVEKRLGCGMKKTALAFLLTTLLPLTVFNSSYWGQCDSLYVAFLVFAVYFLLGEKWLPAFVFVGLALAFKLQAIFILPMLIILYATKKKFTLFYFFVPFLVFWLSGLPAILYGANAFKPFEVYAGQVESSGWVFVNYYNLSTFFRYHDFELMGKYLLIMTFLVCFTMLLYALYKKLDFSGDDLILLAAWSTVCCVLFLPGMHERYGYAGEIFLWIWFMCKPSKRRFVPFIVFYLLGFMANSRFLFGVWPEDSPFLGLMNLVNFCWITLLLVREARPKISASVLPGKGKEVAGQEKSAVVQEGRQKIPTEVWDSAAEGALAHLPVEPALAVEPEEYQHCESGRRGS